MKNTKTKKRKTKCDALYDACRGITGYVQFVVSNEEAVEGDLEALRRFLNAVEDYESNKGERK